jgi:hypothetical protein
LSIIHSEVPEAVGDAAVMPHAILSIRSSSAMGEAAFISTTCGRHARRPESWQTVMESSNCRLAKL